MGEPGGDWRSREAMGGLAGDGRNEYTILSGTRKHRGEPEGDERPRGGGTESAEVR